MTLEPPFFVNGTPPDAAGRRCDALWVQEYWFEGTLEEPANVVFPCLGGVWHHLCFEPGCVFWRPTDGPPVECREDDERLIFRPVDLTPRIGGAGTVVTSLITDLGPAGGPRVRFRFASGVTATFWIDSGEDVSHYSVGRTGAVSGQAAP